jgi:hypothetical protein
MASQQMLIVCDDRYVLVPSTRGPGPTARPGRQTASTGEPADKAVKRAKRQWN